MNLDEILQAAKEAGIIPVGNHHGMEILWWSVSADDLQRFAAIIEKRTIERCADIAYWADKSLSGTDIAAAIRKLGEQ